jgi:aryl-alcohol dehydrogenase-like predicted oxidoreductase
MATPPMRGPGALALGTVQFGLDYGVSNAAGKAPPETARAIVQVADEAGVDRVDTAAAYGDSEAVLSGLLDEFPAVRVITKAPRLVDGDVEAVLARARASAERFGPRLDALLMHSATDLAGPAGARLWAGLEALKAEGLTPRIGFSAYVDDDPLALARRYRPDLAQVAASVFDQRLVASGAIAAMADDGVEVHVRSIFLQGLAFMRPEGVPAKLAAAGPMLARWRTVLEAAGASPARACLDYGLGIEGAARLVVGVTSPNELADILALTSAPPLGLDYSAFALDDPQILDPWRW